MDITAYVLKKDSNAFEILKKIRDHEEIPELNLLEPAKILLEFSEIPDNKDIILAIKRVESKLLSLCHNEFATTGNHVHNDFLIVFQNIQCSSGVVKISSSSLIHNDHIMTKLDNIWRGYIGYFLQKIVIQTLKNEKENAVA